MGYRDRVDVRRLNILSAMEGTDAAAETHCAHAVPNSDAAEKKLWDAYQWKEEIVLRCASIEVKGVVTNARYDGFDKVYELKVDHVVYQKPCEKPAGVSL